MSATLHGYSHGTRTSLTEVTQFEIGRCRAHQSRKPYLWKGELTRADGHQL